jgi:hypothetical protein
MSVITKPERNFRDVSDFTRHCFGARRYSPPSERDVQAWCRAIYHLDGLGLPALGVPLEVLMELYAIADDRLVRALDTIWDTA